MLRILTAIGLVLGLILSTAGAHPTSAAPLNAETVVIQLDMPGVGNQTMTSNWISGWAVDTAAMSGTGIVSIAVYADGDMMSGRLLGQAPYGGDRADVVARFSNPELRYSGFVFNLAGTDLVPGSVHTLTVVAQSTISGDASASISGVTVAPLASPALAPTTVMQPSGATAQAAPQRSSGSYLGLPIIGTNPGGAAIPQDAPSSSTSNGGFNYPGYGYNGAPNGYGYGNGFPAYGGYGNGFNGYGYGGNALGGYYPMPANGYGYGGYTSPLGYGYWNGYYR